MPLTREQVLAEALRLVDEQGVDALSLRTLAARLDVKAPSLYWHVAGKAELVAAVSDAVMGEAIDALPALDPVADWREWLAGALTALRTAMLAHRDGARIVSAAHDSLRRAEFTERAMARLVDAGVDGARAWILVLTGTRYALGHVVAEQGDVPPGPDAQAELERRFPLVAGGVAAYFADHDADDLFRDGVRQVLGAGPA